ncbi:MAG: phosphatidate cytidylyltransferase [Bacteroidales bacterium]|jgi:phosphatidate cytidylyltransferase|nr:phosphatidate cytidylyltransferase [Bacteroidales bacterium]
MKEFWIRTLTGILFLVIMVFGIIWDRAIFTCLFSIILTVALEEFYKMALGTRFRFQQRLGVVTGITAFLLVGVYCFYGNVDLRWLTLILIPLLLIPVSCLFLPSREGLGDLGYIYAGLLYIALPISLSPLLMMDGEVYDGWFLLSLFIMIWCSDVGAYCVGTAFGQKPNSRKLAPSISPKKSWWGFWGGLFFCVAAGVGLHYLTWLPFPLIHCIVLGLIVGAGGVCGDLFESIWKRHFGVKDSGNCIPGHGGMLDRFDSSLVAIPMACVYLSIFGLL